VVPVRHGGDLLGAISLSKPRGEALTGTEDSLLEHLASQASLVMRNAQLTAELRATIEELLASRRRLVGAQDAERRRIERNLHDGPAAADRAGHPARPAGRAGRRPGPDPGGHPRPQGAAQRGAG
jgi:GAF domain-containing protein